MVVRSSVPISVLSRQKYSQPGLYDAGLDLFFINTPLFQGQVRFTLRPATGDPAKTSWAVVLANYRKKKVALASTSVDGTATVQQVVVGRFSSLILHELFDMSIGSDVPDNLISRLSAFRDREGFWCHPRGPQDSRRRLIKAESIDGLWQYEFSRFQCRFGRLDRETAPLQAVRVWSTQP